MCCIVSNICSGTNAPSNVFYRFCLYKGVCVFMRLIVCLKFCALNLCVQLCLSNNSSNVFVKIWVCNCVSNFVPLFVYV